MQYLVISDKTILISLQDSIEYCKGNSSCSSYSLNVNEI